MKFEITKPALMNGLHMVENIVPLRATNPILANVLMEAEGDHVRLTTTNLDMCVQATVPAEVAAAGATTLPVRRLTGVVRELPDSAISVEVDAKNVAAVRCAASFFKILGLSEEEFPRMPKPDSNQTFCLDQGTLGSMLKMTAYAASTDPARVTLNGVLLSLRRKKIGVVATDGRRLALVEREVEDSGVADTDLVLPLPLVHELQRTLQSEGPMTVYAGSKLVAMHYGSVEVTSKLVEGTYPNYRQVIPSQSEHRATVQREDFLAAVRRVALLAADHGVACKIKFERDRLLVALDNPNVGEGRETLSAKYNGRELTMAFNPDFLMDPLKALTSDQVYIELTDEMGPALIKCDEPFVYVLMPVRVA